MSQSTSGQMPHLSKPHRCSPSVLLYLGSMRLLLLCTHPGLVWNFSPRVTPSLDLNLWRDTSLVSLSCFFDWALLHSRIFVSLQQYTYWISLNNNNYYKCKGSKENLTKRLLIHFLVNTFLRLGCSVPLLTMEGKLQAFLLNGPITRKRVRLF